MRKTIEELADNYALEITDAWSINEHCRTAFIDGYSTKTAEIKDLIEKLELTKLEKEDYPLKEEMVNNINAEQDRKINLLKILL